MELILEILNITKTFPGVTAVDNVSFDLMKGEIHCLVGENGAGKSTLIKILSGAIVPTSGVINIFGKKYNSLDPHTSMVLGIQAVYQESNLLENMNIAENIFYGLEKSNKLGFINFKETLNQAKEIMNLLNIKLDPRKLVSELSVAEKQLVKIIKILARNTKILIFDEPTASLNQNEIEDLLKLIIEIKNKGIGIIYISHRIKEVFEIADRITVLRDGKKINTHLIGKVTENELISEMVGRKTNLFYTKSNIMTGKVMLEVKDFILNKNKTPISFEVKEGEIFGIAGMVGAGRSELVKAIMGFNTALKGKVFLENKEIAINKPSDAIKNGICLVPEDRQTEGLFLIRSVKENITIAGLKKFKGIFVQRVKELRFVRELIDKLNIKTFSVEQIVGNLSGGNQQKVVLGKWLFTDAKIFIFDEPTRGIDVGAKQEIYKIIGEIASRGGAIIMISSDMPELISLCDRVLVLRNNEAAGLLKREEINEKNILKLAIG